ncbi:hypothetical protein I5Q34_04655 [Streptomyces sp. AV19]|uniref:hypothetical protein n=1 Tax=Streptomyces sp. AV19 TaxID=2793068 RepID=UPI0018FEB919|nr:hypothetical protein [Streptomyces sp. AV19]MBH1933588.1 hypothetical protein [Streptomyces sp. AV19]MDG4535925.1 hypothetical protein [Streptomyces sp. AV19]
MSSKQSASKSARKSASRERGPSREQTRPQSKAPAAPEPAGPRPARLTAAAALTGLEGAALAAAGVYMLVMGLLGKPDSPQQAELGGLTVLVLALLPLSAARGLWLLRRWSRGPALITQLMALPVAWTLFNTGGAMIAAGVLLALAAVAAMALVVNPTATEALGIGPRAS